MPPKKGNKKQDGDGEESLTRVAIVNGDRYVSNNLRRHSKVTADSTLTRCWPLTSSQLHRCKPKKCRQECKKFCPVVKVGASS